MDINRSMLEAGLAIIVLAGLLMLRERVIEREEHPPRTRVTITLASATPSLHLYTDLEQDGCPSEEGQYSSMGCALSLPGHLERLIVERGGDKYDHTSCRRYAPTLHVGDDQLFVLAELTEETSMTCVYDIHVLSAALGSSR